MDWRWKCSGTDKTSLLHAVILSLRDPETGAFAGDEWGEIDTRFAYCAVACLALLGRLDKLDADKTVEWLSRCKNFDGGFGMVEGAESHAAQGKVTISTIENGDGHTDIQSYSDSVDVSRCTLNPRQARHC